ncbi:MAG: dephospho-CoA kinase [Betaproteobacteria bacterium]|nr:dephospho-CoA kinase [Betaproteobacteria bacterium]
MVKSTRSLLDLKGKVPFLGLTGGIGSGKSSVASYLSKRGAWVIDTDQIAHQITAPGGIAIDPIKKEFGSEFILPDGSLNRAKMREYVFSNAEFKRILEAITHPLIRQETLIQAENGINNHAPYLVFVVPLLLESGTWIESLDHIAVVDCEEEIQIQRVMERSQLDRQDVLAIMAHQASRPKRLAIADTVIHNQGDLASLEIEVDRLHQKMLDL